MAKKRSIFILCNDILTYDSKKAVLCSSDDNIFYINKSKHFATGSPKPIKRPIKEEELLTDNEIILLLDQL